jgi:hypothetical protein
MKPVFQDKFVIPKDRLDVDPQRTGNCFQAALASLFELELGDVPHFMALPPSVDWFEELQKWLLPRGLCALYVQAKNPDGVDLMAQYAGYYLSDGKSPRGSMHTVVSYRGELAHDPHPSGGGLVEETERLFFCVLDVVKRE